jgi:hypothetical protein
MSWESCDRSVELRCEAYRTAIVENVSSQPNPSIERTSSSKLRLLPAAAHVER